MQCGSITINGEYKMDKYIEEGMKCFHKEKGQYINSYAIGTHPYNNFERGWTQAQKRSSVGLLKKYRAESGQMK